MKRNRRNFLLDEDVEEQEEDEVQDQLKMEAVMGASKIMELEELLKETQLHLEQQMNLVGNQKDEIGQLWHQLASETRVRSVMGASAIRKDEAIETARQLTTETIEGLKTSVEQLTTELTETKDRLVTA
jgi:hypothetical protein